MLGFSPRTCGTYKRIPLLLWNAFSSSQRHPQSIKDFQLRSLLFSSHCQISDCHLLEGEGLVFSAYTAEHHVYCWHWVLFIIILTAVASQQAGRNPIISPSWNITFITPIHLLEISHCSLGDRILCKPIFKSSEVVRQRQRERTQQQPCNWTCAECLFNSKESQLTHNLSRI